MGRLGKCITSVFPGLKEMLLAAPYVTGSSICFATSVAVASTESLTHRMAVSSAYLKRSFALPRW